MTRPSTSRSVLATARPRVLSPGNSKADKMAVNERSKLPVSPGWFSFVDLKSEAVTVAGFLHGRPFMKMVCCSGVDAGHVSWRLPLSTAKERLMKIKEQDGKRMQNRKEEFFILV